MAWAAAKATYKKWNTSHCIINEYNKKYIGIIKLALKKAILSKYLNKT